jgi:transcriptional regulator with XRE-family HTH domain
MTTTVFLDGIKLRRLRVIKGFTQRELAQRAGLAPGTIATIEGKGQDNEHFHPSTLRALARALEIEPTELLGD